MENVKTEIDLMVEVLERKLQTYKMLADTYTVGNTEVYLAKLMLVRELLDDAKTIRLNHNN